ncbi:MAG: hypothetical protein KZQ95_10415 [Candidatus Thiodiazotropha sp. (ex Epidulcina cf. delphinae)]|nr:hypothetical protein [Candidatus Thiodiazotropha sp. (ex Epidulcina cf. delphinae)]
MSILAGKLRIGEKIGFGFGLVGLLFLGVIWQYHDTLRQSLADYQRLLDVFGAKKSHALAIENSMLEARLAERDFLIHRGEMSVEEVDRQVKAVLRDAEELGGIDGQATQTAARFVELTNAYHQRFLMIVDAWRIKGLDHNAGLQGAFREAVHELEAMAGRYKVGRLYMQLLQIRRGEKDLGLRREAQYRTRVLSLIEAFKERVADSELEADAQALFLLEIGAYREAFEAYADEVLAARDVDGGKGPFRQAAHRLEALLNAHYVPDLEHNILQLRRREKDYLLRGDEKYVQLAQEELDRIHTQVDASMIAAQEKARLTRLMDNYQRDFLALVEQNRRIDRLTEEMRQAVSEIARLVEENVASANRMMHQMAIDITASTRADERLMLWIVAAASLLGVFFAVTITLRIVHPLRSMAMLLDQLAYEESADRMPFVPDGRDEVNAMAESVNTMADHKARFIAWWKMSMQEAEACEGLEQAMMAESAGDTKSSEALVDAQKELRGAIQSRRELLAEQYREISRLNSGVVEKAERLLDKGPKGEAESVINAIRHSAESIRDILEMASFQSGSKRAAS